MLCSTIESSCCVTCTLDPSTALSPNKACDPCCLDHANGLQPFLPLPLTVSLMIRKNNILEDPASTACTKSRMTAAAPIPKAAVAALPLEEGHLDFQRSRGISLSMPSQIDHGMNGMRILRHGHPEFLIEHSSNIAFSEVYQQTLVVTLEALYKFFKFVASIKEQSRKAVKIRLEQQGWLFFRLSLFDLCISIIATIYKVLFTLWKSLSEQVSRKRFR